MRRAGIGGLATLLVTALDGAAACTSTSPTDARPGAVRRPPDSISRLKPHARPGSWIVSVGDSYISGEGARWAGNTSGRPGPVDALGPHAYAAPGVTGTIAACDRARRSMVDVGPVPGSARLGAVRGRDLACSGATTRSRRSGGVFTPGLDFARAGRNGIGQALALERFARIHRVSTVVVSIGGNDFGFGAIVAACVTAFATGAPPCRHEPAVAGRIDRDARRSRTAEIAAALDRVRTAMGRDGYRAAGYRVVVLTYPATLPLGPDFRYPQSLLARGFSGGCPVYDADSTWATRTVLPAIAHAIRDAVSQSGMTDATVLDLTAAFRGHQLCERGVRQFQQTGLSSWRDHRASSELEWVNMTYAKGAPWRPQESLHPNYWGMVAERGCLRLALRTSAHDLRCVPRGTTLSDGDPAMRLVR